MRFAPVTMLVAALATSAFVFTPKVAAADETKLEVETVAIGAVLTATTDVSLDQATVARGSQVSVASVIRDGSRVVAFALALADGHVVQKVSAAYLRKHFRVLREPSRDA